MENKNYLKLIILFIVIIVIFSSYKIISLKNEIKQLKEDMYIKQECYDLFYDNENLIVLHIDETEEYCNELLGLDE
tara:strand:- start:512 stop:739 length:228 start_codon:yes stop_codon:yes gene_type:complete